MQKIPKEPTISKALRIKTGGDFLDCDIIHDITFGFPFAGSRHRVVALTFDNAQTVGARAILHRQVGITLAAKLQTAATSDLSIANDISGYLAHRGGCVVQCNRAGEVIDFFDLSAWDGNSASGG